MTTNQELISSFLNSNQNDRLTFLALATPEEKGLLLQALIQAQPQAPVAPAKQAPVAKTSNHCSFYKGKSASLLPAAGFRKQLNKVPVQDKDLQAAFLLAVEASFPVLNSAHKAQKDLLVAGTEAERGTSCKGHVDSLRSLEKWSTKEHKGLVGFCCEASNLACGGFSFIVALPLWIWEKGNKSSYHKEQAILYSLSCPKGQTPVISLYKG